MTPGSRASPASTPSLRGAPGLLLVAGILYLTHLAVFRLALGVDPLQGDVLAYWGYSQRLDAPFFRFHLPGYPLLLALTRGLGLNQLPPRWILQSCAFAAFLTGVAGAWRCALPAGGPRAGWFAGLLFALWPLVGLSYAVYPVADGLALALLLWGLDQEQHEHPRRACLLWGLAALTHKATWPVLGLLALLVLLRERRLRDPLAYLLLGGPVLGLWLWGALAGGEPGWILASSWKADGAARGGLPLLDGLVGTFLSGSPRTALKGAVGWSVVAAALLAVGLARRGPAAHRARTLALAGGVVALCLLLNRHTLWAAVRFSKLLALPAGWFLAERLKSGTPATLARCAAGGTLLALLASQLVYLGYMARFLAASGG